jgi:hypothetical protein
MRYAHLKVHLYTLLHYPQAGVENFIFQSIYLLHLIFNYLHLLYFLFIDVSKHLEQYLEQSRCELEGIGCQLSVHCFSYDARILLSFMTR